MNNFTQKSLIFACIGILFIVLYIISFLLLDQVLVILLIVAALASLTGFVLSIMGIRKEKSKMGYLSLILTIPIPLIVVGGIFIAVYEVLKILFI